MKNFRKITRQHLKVKPIKIPLILRNSKNVSLHLYLREFFIYLRECSFLLLKLSVSLVTARQQSETWSVQSFVEGWRLAACQSYHGQTSRILCDFPPSYSPGNVCLDSFPHWTHIQRVSIVCNTILFFS